MTPLCTAAPQSGVQQAGQSRLAYAVGMCCCLVETCCGGSAHMRAGRPTTTASSVCNLQRHGTCAAPCVCGTSRMCCMCWGSPLTITSTRLVFVSFMKHARMACVPMLLRTAGAASTSGPVHLHPCGGLSSSKRCRVVYSHTRAPPPSESAGRLPRVAPATALCHGIIRQLRACVPLHAHPPSGGAAAVHSR